MNRRKLLLGMGTAAAGAGAVFGSGAFTQVEAQRDLTIGIDDDSEALIGIKAGANVTSVDEADSGELVINTNKLGGEGFAVGSTVDIGEIDEDGKVIDGDEAFSVTNNFDDDGDGTSDIDIAIDLTSIDIGEVSGLSSLEFYGTLSNNNETQVTSAGGRSVFDVASGETIDFAIRFTTASTTNPKGLDNATVTFQAGSDLTSGDFPTEQPAGVTRTSDSTSFTSIQAAIDDDNTDSGETLTLGDDTYTESATIDVDSLTLEAAEDASPTIAPGDNTDAIIVSANNATVEGLTIEIGVTDGDATAVDLSGLSSGDSVTLANNTFDADGAEGETYVFDPNGAVDLDAVLNDQGNEFDPDAVAFDRQIIPSAVAPTLIEDWNDLDDVRSNPGGDFALINDLDEDTAGYSDVVDPDGAGFKPIGDGENYPFYGTFDGNGRVIRDLVIDTDGFGGLFEQTGATGAPGEITDLGLEDVDISGTGSVGALVGSNSATITNVYVTGEVEGGDGKLPTTGGLVGTTDGDISQSFSTADVTGPDNVGGLVGKSTATIESSYATGDINVTGGIGTFGGGLVGNNNAGDAVITNSYATGAVNAGGGSGGLSGNAANGELRDSYWDKGTTNQGDAVGPGGGADSGVVGFGSTGDTAPANEMTGDDASNNMDALDFEDTWNTVVGPDGYPVLEAIDEQTQLDAR
ncbi:GLUG motif-containing protein [Halorubrum ezzemoulense]|uniref:GLUG motif-containing protein n=1 Tax=Halorubrum ezzemoulense TaxID=337243 RepID=UPI00232EBE67|nr:GLUG motif-containing protein [Halorubrum ezzemoulense]MDB9252881.1 GLUG motif-containing protein [Halorubrum ezzemoulense]MDB9256735.1 GLUG motif-containing protein [Halorubrum ezzemoulense]MDB9277043.1 GLUG motif-containing protein [Halorubrum ezzemoulense]